MDAELRIMSTVWPELPKSVRAGIVAIVRAAANDAE